MLNEFIKIFELKSLSEQESELEKRKIELSKPLLTKLEYIPMMYKWSCELHVSCGALKKEEADAKFKREFLFVVLYFYSPETLAYQKKIKNGVRGVLAEVLGFTAASGVSNLSLDVATWYGRYKDYQQSIDSLFLALKSRLEAEGLIE